MGVFAEWQPRYLAAKIATFPVRINEAGRDSRAREGINDQSPGGGHAHFSIDVAVALLETRGIPGQIKMDEIAAPRLQVDTLAGGVGAEQDAQRFLGRVGVESALRLQCAPRPSRCRQTLP